MPNLTVIFDPTDRICGLSADDRRRFGIKQATLSIAEDLEENDIYALARKLAEMLLEQL